MGNKIPSGRKNLWKEDDSAEVEKQSQSDAPNIVISEPPEEAPRIKLGICAKDKKIDSFPMQNIVERLKSTHDIDLIFIRNEYVHSRPVKEWPHCHVLICFHRDEEHIKICLEYQKLHQCALVNDIEQQLMLLNRKEVYRILDESKIPTSQHLVLDRDLGDVVEEFEDRIVINGQVMYKPFVEKPFGGSDHNVYLYYGKEQGFGSRRLFRKKKDKSSEYSDVSTIRQEGNYIYEKFIPGGRDIKVYTVGEDYCHAESRKAPTVDGNVERDVFGKEVRRHVKLTEHETEVAKKVVLAFGQRICGFDMLRVPNSEKCVVIDVNGWSFVKNSRKYYDDCARLVREMVIQLARERFPKFIPKPVQCLGNCMVDTEKNHILRAVVGIFRHGDRTPKQKWKQNCTHKRVLDFYERACRVKTPTPILRALQKEREKQIAEAASTLSNVKKRIEAGLNGNFLDKNVFNPSLMPLDLVASEDFASPDAPDFPTFPWKTLEPSNSDFGTPSKSDPQPHTISFTKNNFDTMYSPMMLPRPRIVNGRKVPKFNHTSSDENISNSSSTEKLRIVADAPVIDKVESLNRLQDILDGRAEFKSLIKNGPVDLKITLHANPTLIYEIRDILKDIEGFDFAANVIASEPKGLKVQLRPTYDSGVLKKVKVIVKWGGELTPYGRETARKFGSKFRKFALKSEDDSAKTNFLSVIRAYASDEARVRSTAKEFVMGLLGVDEMPPGVLREGDDIEMILNDVSLSKDKLEAAKETVAEILDQESVQDYIERESFLVGGARVALKVIAEPQKKIRELWDMCNSVIKHLEGLIERKSERKPYFTEDLPNMLWRWRKMVDELYNKKKKRFDYSKIPDVFDCCRYDLRHNEEILKEIDLGQLWDLTEILANFIIPQEYGITKEQKLEVSAGICGRLFEKIAINLKTSVDSQAVLRRTSLFFTSESNMHALRNSLLLSDMIRPNTLVADSLDGVELSYLGHVLIRVFEDPFTTNEAEKMYVEIAASPGCVGDPLRQTMNNPVNLPVVLLSRLPWLEFANFLYSWGGYITTPNQNTSDPIESQVVRQHTDASLATSI